MSRPDELGPRIGLPPEQEGPLPCWHTGKISHATKADAENRARALRRGRYQGSRVKPYRCPFCMLWHVSKGQRGRPGKVR
jgi:hypothetical protein